MSPMSAGEPIELGRVLPLWSALPFAGMLLSIALFPLLAPRFWHRHYPKVATLWGLAFGVPFLLAYGGVAAHELLHIALLDYVPFLILLWGLFTVAGGILVRGRFAGTPGSNLALLLVGTSIASFVGTTGAAMILIRPLLRANEWRKRKSHIVCFFIFLVANVGGSLTPLGDPPLFLGFLHGVPFFWTLRLLPQTAFAAGILLLLFWTIDRYHHARETGAPAPDGDRLGIEGLRNLLFLAGIVGGVLLSGFWKPGTVDVAGIHLPLSGLARDGIILLCGIASLLATPTGLRERNRFSWEPIREVAILFAGIFTTIIPALALLRAGLDGPLRPFLAGIEEPWHYFWATGGLSSFLDNAPTYLSFFTMALGRSHPGLPEIEALQGTLATHPIHLAAISLGAVFMGANTYIGNAPNFMVKSIAEDRGVIMPSFFGYVFRWTIPVLLPIFLVVNVVFF